MIIYKEEINVENKYYIVRGDRSGVFFGQIAGMKKDKITTPLPEPPEMDGGGEDG